MATAIALYNIPKDPRAFDEYYFSKHIPLAKTLPGLRSYDVSNRSVITPDGPSPYHLVAILRFDTMADLQGALASPVGTAVVNDLANFASGGVSVLLFDDKSA